MTELERRALIGDRQAQAECTRQGITLPCPKCYGAVKANLIKAERHSVEMEYKCKRCGLTVKYTQFFPFDRYAAADKTALEQWNTRPAPPIGRCKDCARLSKGGTGYGWCENKAKFFDHFCADFVPK